MEDINRLEKDGQSTLSTADNSSYNSWLKELKQRYLSQRLKASVSVKNPSNLAV